MPSYTATVAWIREGALFTGGRSSHCHVWRFDSGAGPAWHLPRVAGEAGQVPVNQEDVPWAGYSPRSVRDEARPPSSMASPTPPALDKLDGAGRV